MQSVSRHRKKPKPVEEMKVEEKPREEQHKVPTAEEMRDMQTVRVIQKNLVYVIGLPLEVSSEATIRRKDMFGQYGHLSKIVVNNRNPICDKSSTCGVYLTYDTNEQALECIKCVDGFTLCGKLLKCLRWRGVKGRASYGTTKYCFNFTKGQKCTNPDCLYLHHLANKEDCFTKEEMVTRQIEFYQITHPGGGSQWDERLQRYIYHKVSDEYVTSLPPPASLRAAPKKGECAWWL